MLTRVCACDSAHTHVRKPHATLCLFAAFCPGDDVRRYLFGAEGLAGAQGAGVSGRVTSSYSIQEIATYVYSIMNGEHSWH